MTPASFCKAFAIPHRRTHTPFATPDRPAHRQAHPSTPEPIARPSRHGALDAKRSRVRAASAWASRCSGDRAQRRFVARPHRPMRTFRNGALPCLAQRGGPRARPEQRARQACGASHLRHPLACLMPSRQSDLGVHDTHPWLEPAVARKRVRSLRGCDEHTAASCATRLPSHCVARKTCTVAVP